MGSEYLVGSEFQFGRMKNALERMVVTVPNNVNGLRATELYTSE